MQAKLWFIIAGWLFIVMALSVTRVRRLPISTSMLYLFVGVAIGPAGLGLLRLEPLKQTRLLEHVAEVAVIISLFTTGLKLRVPLLDRRWLTPVLLATFAMIICVAAVAVAGVVGLSLPLGAAVLLGAVLAPTDPVLASDVQLEHPQDRDQLRFALTGEAGLNDGTAFPFVMLGLGLLGLHEIGAWGWRWFAVDLVWATVAGLGIGWLTGVAVGALVLDLRRRHGEAVGADDFLALGLIALSYGTALFCHAYGFLAVFAAGLALRNVEMTQAGQNRGGGRRAESEGEPVDDDSDEAPATDQIVTDPRRAPAYMARAVLQFNEQLERLGEVAVVAIVGAIVSLSHFDAQTAWFIPALLLVIRPLAVLSVLTRSCRSWTQRLLMSWFGIRGIGSIYYLMYAINRGVSEDVAAQLFAITLAVVTVSIIVHGVSATPLMRAYRAVVGSRTAG